MIKTMTRVTTAMEMTKMTEITTTTEMTIMTDMTIIIEMTTTHSYKSIDGNDDVHCHNATTMTTEQKVTTMTEMTTANSKDNSGVNDDYEENISAQRPDSMMKTAEAMVLNDTPQRR